MAPDTNQNDSQRGTTALPLFCSALLPGLGQLLRERYLRGLCMMIGFATAIQGHFLVKDLPELRLPSRLPLGLLLAGACIWTLSMLELLLAHSGRPRADRPPPAYLRSLRQGLDAYLAEEPALAKKAFRESQSRAPRELAPYVYLTDMALQGGDRREAETWISQAMACDPPPGWKHRLEKLEGRTA